MLQVFISYKSDDESWAARVADTLEGFGVKVWRDHGARAGLHPGEEWRPELGAAIENSSDMVVLWSKELGRNASAVAHREIALMEKLRSQDPTRRFIPILL